MAGFLRAKESGTIGNFWKLWSSVVGSCMYKRVSGTAIYIRCIILAIYEFRLNCMYQPKFALYGHVLPVYTV